MWEEKIHIYDTLKIHNNFAETLVWRIKYLLGGSQTELYNPHPLGGMLIAIDKFCWDT